jgi:ABC-2 type transport system ATP-binding protein
VRSRPAPSPPATVEADVGAVLEAEAISKLYPSRPVTIFPPVRSIFEREFGVLPGRRSAEEEKEDMRTRSFAAAEYDPGLGGDDEDGDDEDDDDLEPEPTPAPAPGPDELVCVLRDISLRVSPGDSVGIVGGSDAGKSTLLRILGGRAFPTEGRVVAHGRIAPLAADVRKALGLASKVGGHNPVLAMRLLGIEAGIAKRHKHEIEELAQPLLTPDGDPAPGAAQRLAVAATVALPSDVILLDDLRGLDDAFVSRIVERLRERLGEGSALVLASRDTSLAQQLCGRLLLFEGGSLAELGDSSAAVASYNGAARGDRAAAGAAASANMPDGASPSVPSVVRAFNASAALLSAEVQTAFGARSKLFDSRDELSVEVRLETAVRDAEVRCGICFTPRDGGVGFRTELPEPLVVPRPRTHVLVAHFPPGTLPNSGYEVRADATVAVAGEREATLIARVAGRFRIEGDELDFTEPTEPAASCWDGTSVWPVEAEWSIRQERRGR